MGEAAVTTRGLWRSHCPGTCCVPTDLVPIVPAGPPGRRLRLARRRERMLIVGAGWVPIVPMPVLREQLTGRVPVEHIGSHWFVSIPVHHPGARRPIFYRRTPRRAARKVLQDLQVPDDGSRRRTQRCGVGGDRRPSGHAHRPDHASDPSRRAAAGAEHPARRDECRGTSSRAPGVRRSRAPRNPVLRSSNCSTSTTSSISP